jgi:hypothetical protein
MSFRCEKCDVAQPDGCRPVLMVTKTRLRASQFEDSHTYLGWEIAEEKKLCEPCAGETQDEAQVLRDVYGTPEMRRQQRESEAMSKAMSA